MSSSSDRVDTYAQDVVSGRRPAGPQVRDACAKHMRERLLAAQGELDGFVYDEEKSARAIRFFENVLKLDNPDSTDILNPYVPFLLIDWQAFIVGSIFGWVNEQGFRRFRTAYVETGKGSGKSPLAAGIGLYGQIADGEAKAEIYAAARTKDQAQILFRDAVAMVKASNLRNMAGVMFRGGEGNEWNIYHPKTSSFFRPISSEDGKSGPRPHIGLLDEIHEHVDSSVVDLIRAGTKGRRQALIFMITNSGSNKTGVCYEYHEYGKTVVLPEDDPKYFKDLAFFAYICSLDDGDDPFKSEECWAKANPSLGITFQLQYLRELVNQARGMPASEGIVRRLNFCQWTDSVSEWIDRDLFEASLMPAAEYDAIDKTGMSSFGGLDLSMKKDLTSYSETHYDDITNTVYLEAFFWTPADTMDQRARVDKVPYRRWAEDGHIFANPGRSIDKQHVAAFVYGRYQANDLHGLAFDNAMMDDFMSEMEHIGADSHIEDDPEEIPGPGLRLVRHGQGYAGFNSKKVLWMNLSIEHLSNLFQQGRIKIKWNPCFIWNSASAVITTDAQNNKKWDKQKSTGRIDGVVSATMSVGLLFQTEGVLEDVRDMLDAPMLEF